MTAESRESMERAIGIIEGVSFCVPQNVQDALAVAADILESVLSGEEQDNGNKKI